MPINEIRMRLQAWPSGRYGSLDALVESICRREAETALEAPMHEELRDIVDAVEKIQTRLEDLIAGKGGHRFYIATRLDETLRLIDLTLEMWVARPDTRDASNRQHLVNMRKWLVLARSQLNQGRVASAKSNVELALRHGPSLLIA